MGSEKRRALWYIMYCSVDVKVVGWWEGGEVEVGGEGEGEGDGAVKVERYHCERKPWGCSVSRQKKRGAMGGGGGKVRMNWR